MLIWFFFLGFACRQKPDVLECSVGFYNEAQRFVGLRSWRFRSTILSASSALDTENKCSINILAQKWGFGIF